MKQRPNKTHSHWWGLLLAMLVAAAAVAQDLPVAGEGQGLWIVLPQADTKGPILDVLHHQDGQPADQIRRAQVLRGRLAPGGLTAGGGQLWLVYDDGSVQSLVPVVATPAAPASEPYESALKASLRGVALRSLAVGPRGPWALVQVVDPAVLAAIDQNTFGRPAQAPATAGAAVTTRPAEAPATAPPLARVPVPSRAAGGALVPATAPRPTTTAPAVPPLAASQERLLRLERDRWVKVDLPTAWPNSGSGRWLVSSPSPGQWPLLVAQTSGEEGPVLWIFERGADPKATGPEAWTVYRRSLTRELQGEVRLLAVNRQLVLAQARMQTQRVDVDLSLLRPESETLLPIGRLSAELSPGGRWGLASVGGTAALVVAADHQSLAWTRMNLQGQLISPQPVKLKIDQAKSQIDPTWILVVVASLTAAILLLVFLQGRDAPANRLALPAELVVADLPRRLLGGLIDLVPPVVLVALFYGIRSWELLGRWPGQGTSLVDMLPGALVIVLYVLHTMISEMIWSRSLGKMILGLQVTNLTGQRPRYWQILLRDGLKALDLILPPFPLLLLPLMNPQRQRLGDMIGRTVVVMPKPEESEGEQGEDEE